MVPLSTELQTFSQIYNIEQPTAVPLSDEICTTSIFRGPWNNNAFVLDPVKRIFKPYSSCFYTMRTHSMLQIHCDLTADLFLRAREGGSGHPSPGHILLTVLQVQHSFYRIFSRYVFKLCLVQKHKCEIHKVQIQLKKEIW